MPDLTPNATKSDAAESIPVPATVSSTSTQSSQAPTPLRCFMGAAIAAPMTLGLYALTTAIAHTFAQKPVPMGNQLTTQIAVLVRTLVVGTSALGTGIFGITTLGLMALGLQLLIKKDAVQENPSSD